MEDIFLRLVALVGRRAHATMSLRIDDASMWGPDVWIEREGVDRSVGYLSAADVELVVEVSRSSMHRDLGPKLRGYATAGVPAYWVVSPDVDGYVLAHTDPAEGTYRHIRRIELPGGYRDLSVEDLWRGAIPDV